MSQESLDRRFFENLEWARWAVSRWSEFPMHQVPRPLVVAGQDVLVEGGFTSHEAKSAFLEGRIEWRVAVPEAVRSALEHAQTKPGPAGPGAPFAIQHAARGETRFLTDRGPRRLPAWQLRADGEQGSIWVLDPDVRPWQPQPGAGGPPPELEPPAHDPFAQIEVEDDDQSVILHWLGSPPPYDSYPLAVSLESEQAVALVARGTHAGRASVRAAVGYMHRVPARLNKPLGARVFVDLHGNARQAIRTALPDPTDVAAYEARSAEVMVGPPEQLSGGIELRNYDPAWPAMYEREAARVRGALGQRVIRLEHVGSTSVPGLTAKPIIDMALEVPDSSDEQAYVPDLEAAGYVLRIRESEWFEHRLFKRPEGGVHLHVFSAGCSETDAMVTFRDWLRSSAEDRDLYARAKHELASRDWTYMQQYADAKTDVVRSIQGRASVTPDSGARGR